MQWRSKNREVNLNVKVNVEDRGTMTLPSLEDANSIQAGLAEILRLLATQQIEHRTAALMLYALQTASANLKHTSFEPEPTRVVIDRESVGRRPIGATAWSGVKGCDYDELLDEDEQKEYGAKTRSAALRLVLEKFGPGWVNMLEELEAGEAGELAGGAESNQDEKQEFAEN